MPARECRPIRPAAKFVKTTPRKVANRFGRASGPISSSPRQWRSRGDVLAAIVREGDVAAALDCERLVFWARLF
jgi:hypothetical protein